MHKFTPEESIRIQKKLGADIILAFDECVPRPSTHKYTKQAMERTHAWAKRCLEEFRKPSDLSSRAPSNDGAWRSHDKRLLPRQLAGRNDNFKQALYGIVQGGAYKDLREESSKFISNLDFDGIAIGGVSVGESKKEMRDAIDWSVPFLPDEKPRHLLGIGEVDDIFDAVERGMDTFDCVTPTRLGRYGLIFVSPPEGKIKNKLMIDIKKSIFARDQNLLSKNCKCSTCENFTRGYVHHLFRSNELLAYRLASYHNLFFINNLVKEIRESILEGRFGNLKKSWLGI